MPPANKKQTSVVKGKGSAVFVPASGTSSATPSTGDVFRVKTTLPDQLLRHNISDEELTIMENSSSDISYNTYLTAFGIAAGTVVPAVRDIYGLLVAQPPTQFDFFILLNLGLFIGSCTAAVVARTQAMVTKSQVQKTTAAIRERSNHRLQVVKTEGQ